MSNILDDSVKLRLTFSEEEQISLLDMSSLLYDLTLLYDTVVIGTIEGYEKFEFNQFFWRRNGRSIKKQHQIMVRSIRHQSPLELVTILTAAAAGSPAFLWAFVQFLEKVNNWKLNREKLELEVLNLRKTVKTKDLEIEHMRLENQNLFIKNQILMSERDVISTAERIISRIELSPLKAINAHIFITEPPEKTLDKQS